MNKYKTYIDFMGTDDPLRLQPNTDGWTAIARDIRGQLEDKAYLLDNPLPYQEQLTRHNIYYVALANTLPTHHTVSPPHPASGGEDGHHPATGVVSGDWDAVTLSRWRNWAKASGPAFRLLTPHTLTYRDNETSRQVFQLVLEQSFKTEEKAKEKTE